MIVGAYVEYEDDDTPPGDAAGLHLHFKDPVPLKQGRAHWGTGTFLRRFVNAQGAVEQLSFANYNTRWWVLDDGRHLYGEVHDYQAEDVEELQKVGIIQGDWNRNGHFGARDNKGVPLLNPGKPEESYLVARLRGHMQGDPIPGTRMPLANQPPSVTDMLALMCLAGGAGSERQAVEPGLADRLRGVLVHGEPAGAEPGGGGGDVARARVAHPEVELRRVPRRLPARRRGWICSRTGRGRGCAAWPLRAARSSTSIRAARRRATCG